MPSMHPNYLSTIQSFIDNRYAICTRKPLILALSAPQGSGKTYLTTALAHSNPNLLELSLDDFYHTFADQQQLFASTMNPLYEFRGNPGTHDLELLVETLSRLKSGPFPMQVPRYDKSMHDGRGGRLSAGAWRVVEEMPDVIVIEGWCLGFKSILSDEILSHQVDSNSATSLYKHDHIRQVNEALKEYERLNGFFDAFIALEVTDLRVVYAWRDEQEQKTNGGQLNALRVASFVDRFMPAYELYYRRMIIRGLTGHNGPFLCISIDSNRKLINTTI